MKYLFLLIPFISFSQDEGDKYSVDSIILIQGAKDSLFNKSKLWFSNVSNTGTTPSVLIDKETGSIICPVSFQFYTDNFYFKKRDLVKGGKVEATGGAKVKVFVKDNKVKIIVTDLVYYDKDFEANKISTLDSWSNSNINTKDSWQKEHVYEYLSVIENIKIYSKKLIVNYAEYLNKKSETDF